MPRKSPLKMYLELQANKAAGQSRDPTIGGKLEMSGASKAAKAGAAKADAAKGKAAKGKAAAKVGDLERGAVKMPAGDAEKMKAEFNAREQLRKALAEKIAAEMRSLDSYDIEAAQVSSCLSFVLAAYRQNVMSLNVTLQHYGCEFAGSRVHALWGRGSPSRDQVW